MKILQISHGYNAPFLGVSNHYSAMLSEHGEVTTLYLSGKESDLIREKTRSESVIFWEQNSKSLRGMKFGLVFQLYRLIRDEQFDLVLCHRYKAIYMTALTQLLGLKFKQIGVIHGFGDFKRLGRRFFLSFFKKRLLLLGVSNSVRDDIRESMEGFPADKVLTLYNAIDVNKVASKQLNRKEARAYLGLKNDMFIIGNVGRLHPDKDQATLIRGFAKFNKDVPLSQLVIMGHGRLEEALKALADELGLAGKVVFLGQVESAVNYYRAFDLFALSSDREPFGLVLLEAMVAQVPVIATNCGGAAEVVEGIGGLFNFRDASSLYKLMLIAKSGKNIYPMDKTGSKIQQKFSFEATSDVLAKILIGIDSDNK